MPDNETINYIAPVLSPEAAAAQTMLEATAVITTASTNPSLDAGLTITAPEPAEPVVAEMRDEVVSELRGNFPNVPFSPGVDIEALTAGNPKPVFLTLPVAEVGRRSANKYPRGSLAAKPLLYDEHTVAELERQIIEDRTGGIMGHLSDDERATRFPNPDAIWVGAKRVGKTLWAKAYARQKPFADYVNDLKAVGGKISTSIYTHGGTFVSEGDATLLRNFKLESLDFGPVFRTAIDLGGDFALTSEMQDSSQSVSIEETTPMTPDEFKAELAKMSDADLFTALGDKAPALAEQYAVKNKQKLVAAEMEAVEPATISELKATTSTQAATISELTERVSKSEGVIAEYRQREFTTTVAQTVAELTDWNATSDDAKAKLAVLRKAVTADILAELTDLDTAKVKDAGLKAFEANKVLAEMTRDALSGGSLRMGGSGRSDDPNSSGKIATPEQQREAAARTGISYS